MYFFCPSPCIIFLDGSPNDQLLTVHWQISWLPAPGAWSYTSILIHYPFYLGNFSLFIYLMRTWQRKQFIWYNYFECFSINMSCDMRINNKDILNWIELNINEQQISGIVNLGILSYSLLSPKSLWNWHYKYCFNTALQIWCKLLSGLVIRICI